LLRRFHLRGHLARRGPAPARIRRAVPHALLRRDRQRGHAVARAGGPARERAVRLRHAREPGGGPARVREADPPRAGAHPGGAVAVKHAPSPGWSRAGLVGPALEDLLRRTDAAARVQGDPVELVHAYSDPLDVEVAGLLCAALA